MKWNNNNKKDTQRREEFFVLFNQQQPFVVAVVLFCRSFHNYFFLVFRWFYESTSCMHSNMKRMHHLYSLFVEQMWAEYEMHIRCVAFYFLSVLLANKTFGIFILVLGFVLRPTQKQKKRNKKKKRKRKEPKNHRIRLVCVPRPDPIFFSGLVVRMWIVSHFQSIPIYRKRRLLCNWALQHACAPSTKLFLFSEWYYFFLLGD